MHITSHTKCIETNRTELMNKTKTPLKNNTECKIHDDEPSLHSVDRTLCDFAFAISVLRKSNILFGDNVKKWTHLKTCPRTVILRRTKEMCTIHVFDFKCSLEIMAAFKYVCLMTGRDMNFLFTFVWIIFENLYIGIDSLVKMFSLMRDRNI